MWLYVGWTESEDGKGRRWCKQVPATLTTDSGHVPTGSAPIAAAGRQTYTSQKLSLRSSGAGTWVKGNPPAQSRIADSLLNTWIYAPAEKVQNIASSMLPGQILYGDCRKQKPGSRSQLITRVSQMPLIPSCSTHFDVQNMSRRTRGVQRGFISSTKTCNCSLHRQT
ncbi:hypothetical protein SCHPADRAFT_605320 [Schizopora paradoxa]|uniref:Uncharacterized protein n=1 Tax=Schizopora paradoxa TaxID=27342 RepID=A0A0H2RUN2_9AGAM|nr:hypothetical protein SCHPADRAFT_605320 [Schizopora paradoxa]